MPNYSQPKSKRPQAANGPLRAHLPSEKGLRAADAAAPRDSDAPHWLPTGHRWQKIPPEIRDAVSRIVTPAYRRFVLDAPDELERSVGLTLVHLMWIEICDQVKMAIATADPESLDAVLSNPDNLIERHLRLATVKCQTAELLLKLRVATNLLNQPPASPLPLGDGPGVKAALNISPRPLAGEGQGVRAACDAPRLPSPPTPSPPTPSPLSSVESTPEIQPPAAASPGRSNRTKEPEIGKPPTC